MIESQPTQFEPTAEPENPSLQTEAPPIIPPEMPAKSEWIERGDPKQLDRREID
jgi:hypothetical protein